VDEIQRLEELLSVYRPASEISRINQAAGFAPIRVSPATYAAIKQAIHFARLSSGAFDPTIVDGARATHRKGSVECDASVDYRRVILNPHDQTVYLPVAGMGLNLGGIGKGFALDCAIEHARQAPDVGQVFINFGGQLLFWTPKSSFDPVKVGIEDPKNQGRLLSIFDIRSNCSISTSSNAERPAHLIDPRSGRPAQSVESATVIAPTATEAEAWSTALFVSGPSERSTLLKEHPEIKAFLSPARRRTFPN
jgi:thiamine biosynthesis lipoprotein